jgi:hypothetical protein
VCAQLREIIAENKKRSLAQGEEVDVAEEFNSRDLVAEIATEEFICKNIRVRPISGHTTADREDQKSDIHGKGLLTSDIGSMGIMDEEEKFNANANIEMDEQRSKVKELKRAREQEEIKNQLKLLGQ